MIVTTFNNKSQSNVIEKNLEQLQTFDISLIHEFNILKPTLIFTKSNFTKSNYIYIPQYNRYYFINDITTSPGNRVQLDCNIDVLKTYGNDIKKCSCVVLRSESAGVNNIVDDKLPIAPNQFFVVAIDLTPVNPLPTETNGGYLVSVF